MNAGDLVRGKRGKNTFLTREEDPMGPRVRYREVTGILLRRIDPQTGWWEVLCEDGLIVKESENYMDLLQETR